MALLHQCGDTNDIYSLCNILLIKEIIFILLKTTIDIPNVRTGINENKISVIIK